jgi:hypothetical protein
LQDQTLNLLIQGAECGRQALHAHGVARSEGRIGTACISGDWMGCHF